MVIAFFKIDSFYRFPYLTFSMKLGAGNALSLTDNTFITGNALSILIHNYLLSHFTTTTRPPLTRTPRCSVRTFRPIRS